MSDSTGGKSLTLRKVRKICNSASTACEEQKQLLDEITAANKDGEKTSTAWTVDRGVQRGISRWTNSTSRLTNGAGEKIFGLLGLPDPQDGAGVESSLILDGQTLEQWLVGTKCAHPDRIHAKKVAQISWVYSEMMRRELMTEEDVKEDIGSLFNRGTGKPQYIKFLRPIVKRSGGSCETLAKEAGNHVSAVLQWNETLVGRTDTKDVEAEALTEFLRDSASAKETRRQLIKACLLEDMYDYDRTVGLDWSRKGYSDSFGS